MPHMRVVIIPQNIIINYSDCCCAQAGGGAVPRESAHLRGGGVPRLVQQGGGALARHRALQRWAVIGGELVTWPPAHLWLVQPCSASSAPWSWTSSAPWTTWWSTAAPPWISAPSSCRWAVIGGDLATILTSDWSSCRSRHSGPSCPGLTWSPATLSSPKYWT